MKAKHSVILFLFVCLLSTVALSRAETDVNGWLANIYIKEQRDADFEQWTAGYKCSILRYMKEVGVEVGDVPHPEDADADVRCNALIRHFAPDTDMPVSMQLMTVVKGPRLLWSLQDKARMNQLERDTGNMPQSIREILPGEGDATYEQVIETGLKAMTDYLDVTPEQLSDMIWGAYFYADAEHETPYWIVTFAYPPNADVQSFFLTHDGQLSEDRILGFEHPARVKVQTTYENALEETIQALEQEKGLRHTWSLADQLLLGPPHALPDEKCIPAEQAIRCAYAALKEYNGFTKEKELKGYTPYVAFTENGEESKHYLVSFGTETKTFVIVTIDALSGVGLTFCISSK